MVIFDMCRIILTFVFTFANQNSLTKMYISPCIPLVATNQLWLVFLYKDNAGVQGNVTCSAYVVLLLIAG